MQTGDFNVGFDIIEVEFHFYLLFTILVRLKRFKEMSSKKPFGTLLLDIDECLIHAYEVAKHPTIVERVNKRCAKNPALRQRKFSIVLNDGEEFVVIKRPHLDKLLSCAFRLFEHVVVWSAGRKDYVNLVVSYLFTHQHQHPAAVFSRDECIYITEKDYHKPLSALKKKHSDLLNRRTLLFVDDKDDNYREDPEHGICIPQFKPSEENPFNEDDDMLLRFIEWLMQPSVRIAHDVRTLDKSEVFQTIYSGRYADLMASRKRFLFTPLSST